MLYEFHLFFFKQPSLFNATLGLRIANPQGSVSGKHKENDRQLQAGIIGHWHKCPHSAQKEGPLPCSNKFRLHFHS